jgi:SMC interacting uncharacterized protein involved in chromosome segregation
MHRLFCFVTVLVGLSLNVQAELYRYVDDKGVTVLDDRVPAGLVKHGYAVLDNHGRVKQIIPAARTPEELEADRAAYAAQKRQLDDDTTMLRLYSSVPDLERAKTRQLNQIQSLIETTHTNIADLQVQREELQRRAANQQRVGRTVDEVILRELAEVDAETARLERLIAAKQLEVEEVKASFAVSRARLEVLLGT